MHCFSPTGGTRRVATVLAEALAAQLDVPLMQSGYTLPSERTLPFRVDDGGLLLWASPVYAGRLPNKTLDYLSQTLTPGSLRCRAVAVVVYGNRSFGDALAELGCLLTEAGARVEAGVAAVARHAFTDAVAGGRPNEADQLRLRRFAADIAAKLRGSSEASPLLLPGEAKPQRYYTPLQLDGRPAQFLKATPEVDPLRCQRCGLCLRVCPMGSVDSGADGLPLFRTPCIKCQACRRSCPHGAIAFTNADFLSHVAMLEAHYRQPQAPQLFL